MQYTYNSLKPPFHGIFHLSSHSVVKWKIYSHRKNISSNHLFSDFFSKNVAFANFLPKMGESKFLKLPHCGSRQDYIFSKGRLHKILVNKPRQEDVEFWVFKIFFFFFQNPLHYLLFTLWNGVQLTENHFQLPPPNSNQLNQQLQPKSNLNIVPSELTMAWQSLSWTVPESRWTPSVRRSWGTWKLCTTNANPDLT